MMMSNLQPDCSLYRVTSPGDRAAPARSSNEELMAGLHHLKVAQNQKGVLRSGEKTVATLKKFTGAPPASKEVRSSTKKTVKELIQVNSESKRELKKKPSTAGKELPQSINSTQHSKELTLLAKQLSNRLFAGIEPKGQYVQVATTARRSEKKKESIVERHQNTPPTESQHPKKLAKS